jgi:hypothetical protein
MVLHRSRKPGPYGHPGSIPGGGVIGSGVTQIYFICYEMHFANKGAF